MGIITLDNDDSPNIEINSDISPIEEKRELKHRLKGEVKKKFIIGAKYILGGSKKGFKKDDRVFLLKKFVYSVENRRTNILIMKQIAGKNMTSGHLSRHDCLILHIKYEPGLQVWPMELKWHILKEKVDETIKEY
ncbi:MAG: hypothetical protein [Wendovervirus sonii]|uniref:Endonuclease n=1 Tax=phage Lak_Megaphage_Sonny TaxID=3109229 RepID=A0ABZ0Z3N1_9CAUD|nr:MAG: hypothetical protein [phage Lak_Megaphage_Sonny]